MLGSFDTVTSLHMGFRSERAAASLEPSGLNLFKGHFNETGRDPSFCAYMQKLRLTKTLHSLSLAQYLKKRRKKNV